MSRHAWILIYIICIVSGVQAFEKDETTVGLWNMNEGVGTVLKDESGNNIDLKLYITSEKKNAAKPKWVVTPKGRGVIFRAEDEWQFSSRSVKLSNQVSFEAWLKPVKNGKAMGLYQSMIYKKNGYRINLSKSLNVVFLLNGKGYESGLSSKTTLKSGEWVHIACTYDSEIVRIYINGKLDSEKEMPGYDLSETTYSTLGYTGGSPYFNGIIDEIRISEIALNEFMLEE